MTSPIVGSQDRKSLVILVAVPLLVGGVGLFVLLNSYWSMRGSTALLSTARFEEIAQGVAHRTKASLAQAQDMIALVKAHARLERTATPQGLGSQLGELVRTHPAVAWATWSEPNGHHLGAFVEDTGQILLNDVRVSAQGSQLEQYEVMEKGALKPHAKRSNTGFDPRQRPFYTLALKHPGRQWTQPYIFFDRGVPGVTATEAVYTQDGQLAGVVTVDFDLQSLSQFLANLDAVPQGAAVIFDEQGRILAYSKSTLRGTHNAGLQGEIPTAETFQDPTLKAFFEAQKGLSWGADDVQSFSFDQDRHEYLATARRFEVDGGRSWFVGVFAPQDALMGPAKQNNLVGLLISGVGLGLGVIFSLWVVRRLTRAKRAEVAARAAEVAARADEEKAREGEEKARAEAEAAKQKVLELGSYRLIEKLGEGGMGEVWKAEHSMLTRPVAVKLIRAEGLHPQQAINLFFQEARATALLKSRNTVAVYDFGVTDDGVFFYVMELLEGIDLESLVAREGALTTGRIVHILMQVCDSLAEAHEAGLIHRDIKPANIYIAKVGREVDVVKVLDFGLVLHTAEGNEGQAPHDVAGTPGYIAPEVITRKGLDHRADLYAVGCVAYWLLTGRLVFEDMTPSAEFAAHVNTVPSLPSTWAENVNPHLEAIVMACLAKDRTQRPQTADALRAQLRTVHIAEREVWTEDAARRWWQTFSVLPSQDLYRNTTPAAPVHRTLMKTQVMTLVKTDVTDIVHHQGDTPSTALRTSTTSKSAPIS